VCGSLQINNYNFFDRIQVVRIVVLLGSHFQ